MSASLASEFGAVLQYERKLRERTAHGVEPSTHDWIRLHRRRIRLLQRAARECQAEGDVTGLTEITREIGRIVTEIHRLAKIGVCPHCDISGHAVWLGNQADHDIWRCERCGRTWRSPGIPGDGA